MKKPESKVENNTERKRGFKEFWANKSTRWTLIAFGAVIVVTIIQFILLALR